MITTILFIMLTALVSLFVLQPLMNPGKGRKHGSPSSNHVAGELIERKEAIYAAIKDIEFDYQTGKLSEEDFRQLRQQYKDEAIAVLKKLDKSHSSKSPKKSTAAKSQANFCSSCGNPVKKTDRFCTSCGSKL